MTSKSISIIVLAACLCACTPQKPVQTLRKHPNLAKGAVPFRSVAVVPPDLSAFRLTFHGDMVPLLEERDSYRFEVTDWLQRKILEKGFTVRSSKLSDEELAADALRLPWAEAVSAQRLLSTKAYQIAADLTLSEAIAFRATMGPEVGYFAERADVDTLVFSNVMVLEKSPGMRAKDTFFVLLFALWGTAVRYPTSYAIVEVMVVDGTTGELLWSDRRAGFFYQKTDLRWLMDQTLVDFPSLPRQETRRREASADTDSAEAEENAPVVPPDAPDPLEQGTLPQADAPSP